MIKIPMGQQENNQSYAIRNWDVYIRKKNTLHVLQCQNLQRISTAHFWYTALTTVAQKWDWRTGEQIGFPQAPFPGSGQSCRNNNPSNQIMVRIIFHHKNQQWLEKIHRNIWSSFRYCFRDFVIAAEDSESRPKGFSTMTLVQPLPDDAEELAHLTASMNILGGMDR